MPASTSSPAPATSPGQGSLTELLARAAAGDEHAFARIVRLHHADLVRAAFLVTGDEDLADASARAAWPVAWRRLRSVRGPDDLSSWLASIAAREAEAASRRRLRRSGGTASPVAPASAHQLQLRAERAATMPVRPIDADAVAASARLEAESERGRRISVAVSAVVGLLVAAAPWILPALHR